VLGAALAWLVAAAAIASLAARLGASAPLDAAAGSARPDTLVVLSTTDVKGKTSPCGCHTPKGGLARRAGLVDSLRATFGQTLLVDSGGWFPEGDTMYRDVAAFMAEEMVRSGTAAAGLGERDLRYGLGFLRAQVRRTGLPLVSANLLDASTHQPAFAPWRLVRSGSVTVGVFSLLAERADLGPAGDSLRVGEPTAAAFRAVTEMRAKGATVVVLLSNLGKVESEDLVTAISGIDVVVAGRNVPVLPRGRMVQHTVACYGGEQGHYLGVTVLALDAARHAAGGENTTAMLGPDVPEEAPVLERVRAFEDAFNEKLRQAQLRNASHAALAAGAIDDEPKHYVGVVVCARCHAQEYAQWQTTAHARAWRTLVEQRKDATPECVPCHVLGYQKPGGYQGPGDVGRLTNVQCEMCHGMGTEHESWPARSEVLTERTCQQCHTDVTSPDFKFATYRPHILHHVPADLPPLPARPASRMLGK
jgi:2',3'-cyclic-nucleotide 2'-phosphodiesterase (5'-nucleotidase family)